MNNLSSYCGLVDAKIRASDKDLPVKVERLNVLNESFHLILLGVIKAFKWLLGRFLIVIYVIIMCPNEELSLTMS